MTQTKSIKSLFVWQRTVLFEKNSSLRMDESCGMLCLQAMPDTTKGELLFEEQHLGDCGNSFLKDQ